MKRYTLILALLTVLHLNPAAQSIESNALYAEGIELYNQGKYAEAIPYFELSDRLDKAELDSLSSRRNYSSDWLASCYYRLGDETTAKEYDPTTYRLPPIDRRLTIVRDSIEESYYQDLRHDRVFSAIPKVKEMSALENILFSPDHYIHISSNRDLAYCYMMTSQTDKALPCIEESVRLIRLNFGERDTLQMQELLFLVDIYSNDSRFDMAEKVVREMKEVVNENYDNKHTYNVNASFIELRLMLMQRKWDKARQLLPNYVKTVKRCLADRPEEIKGTLYTIRDIFSSCGRKEEEAYINDMITKGAKQDSDKEYFDAVLSRSFSELNVWKRDKVKAGIKELERVVAKMPETAQTEICKAGLESLRCIYLLSCNQIEEAKDVFAKMKEQKYDELVEEDDISWSHFQTTRIIIDMMMGEFEDAAEVCDKMIESMDSVQMTNQTEAAAMQATFHAFAGNYVKAREIAARNIAIWRQNVIDKKSLYRLDRDTARINSIVKASDMYMRYTFNLPDSARYAIGEIKGEYLLLKLQMLRNMPDFMHDDDYLYCIYDYIWAMKSLNKYAEVREVMEQYLDDWHTAFSRLNPSPQTDTEKITRQRALRLLEFALNFRCQYCYERDDPGLKQAYDDFLTYEKEQQGVDENSEAYRNIKLKYLETIRDDKAIVEYLSTYVDEADTEALYRKMADSFENLGDKAKAIVYRRKELKKQLGKSGAEEGDLAKAGLSLWKIIEYKKSEGDDPEILLRFLQDEIWPLLDENGPQQFPLFVSTINYLSWHIKNDTFIPYIQKEIGRMGKVVDTPAKKACVFGAIASVLASCKDVDGAYDYLGRARALVKGDKALDMYLGCQQYNVISQTQTRNDEAISLGFQLLGAMENETEMKQTYEYMGLMERQLGLLMKQSRYKEMIDIGVPYLKDCADLGLFNSWSLWNEKDPLYAEIGPAYSGMHNLDHKVFRKNVIRERVFYAQAARGADGEIENALEVIRDKSADLEEAMDGDYYSTWVCDDLMNFATKVAYKYGTDSLRIHAYDAALFCKGLKMRSDNAVRAMIKSSGHKGALRKFDHLQAVVSQLQTAKGHEADSLTEKRKEIERDLYRLSKNFGDYKNYLRSSWKNVRDALGEKDVAIEFITGTDSGHDMEAMGLREGYFALVLKKGMAAPAVAYIAAKDSIEASDYIYADDRLGGKLLRPLAPYLEGVENIYYSPIGELNRISVESLPLPGGKGETLSSRYDMYRLTSTREICGDKLSVEGKGAVVYGGLLYDTSIGDMVSDARQYHTERTIVSDEFSDDEVKDLRALIKGIPYLAGTKTEAEDVSCTLNSTDDEIYSATAMIGSVGTEASFKALDGRQKRVIHIATHGFYFDRVAYISMKPEDSDNPERLSEEDESLRRSGLFFAGASNRYRGADIPEGVDDGILTAREIAVMDLSGLDLCVLSACQTAQGDVSSEGVYGLQRGFKKAGAKSMLMSLWKVDDEATGFLMREFYHHWIAGKMSKYKALEKAKQAVRSRTDKGWDKPKYWASFILLDALD